MFTFHCCLLSIFIFNVQCSFITIINSIETKRNDCRVLLSIHFLHPNHPNCKDYRNFKLQTKAPHMIRIGAIESGSNTVIMSVSCHSTIDWRLSPTSQQPTDPLNEQPNQTNYKLKFENTNIFVCSLLCSYPDFAFN